MTNINDNIIYLLIGPKGSGKSFIGTLFDQQFHIKFLRVEDWAKDIKKDRHINDEAYIKEVFQTIEAGVRKALKAHSNIVFESTGLSDYFDQMLKNLKDDFIVITINVQAEHSLCQDRIKKRDKAIHIDVSDEQVNVINEQVLKKDLNTDFCINNNENEIEELTKVIEEIIKSTTPIK